MSYLFVLLHSCNFPKAGLRVVALWVQQFAHAAVVVASVVAAATAAQLFCCPHAVVPVFSLLEAVIPILLPAKCIPLLL